MLKLHPIDGILLAGYILFLVVVTWRTRNEAHGDESEYLLAGRRLTLPAFVATLVSTWYGGILGVGEYSFTYGISNWLVFGVPYYLAALLYALFLANRIRISGVTSISDQLEKAFGRRPALIGAGVVFVMTVPAAYVLMIGVLLQATFGGQLAVWVVIGTLLSTIYIAFGGFRSVVRTDAVQFVLMYIGFILLLTFAVIHSGGLTWLKSNLPKDHLTWNGGLPIGAVLVWYVIALSTLVNPGFHQRCSAARDSRTARRGILVSILFWVLFDALTSFSGLYARAILGPGADPLLSYPLLAAKVLPPGVTGLFLLGLVSVILSTVDSYGFLAAQTLGRDLVARARGTHLRWDVRRIQWGLLASALLAVLIALWKESVVKIWYDLGSVGTPMLLLPLIASFRKRVRFRDPWVSVSMLLAGVSAAVWTFLGSYGTGYPFGVQPIFIGLFVGVVTLFPGYIRNR
ncbi:MAG: sodium:solute symporter family protein [bacterium]